LTFVGESALRWVEVREISVRLARDEWGAIYAAVDIPIDLVCRGSTDQTRVQAAVNESLGTTPNHSASRRSS